jgi:hypothetical protein
VTERWRTRLEHIDKAGPSDEVFERAHRGPQAPDDPIGGPGTGTRIVTAVAAFSVFALAIAVFAIPMLRLRQGLGDAASPSLLPLWPVRSLEDVERTQTLARDGDVHAAFLLDAKQTAIEFGRRVMGWDGAFASERRGADTWFGHSPVQPSSSTLGASSYGYPSGYPSGVPGYPSGYPSGVPSAGSTGSGIPSAGTPPPFRIFRVYPCDPANWHMAGTDSLACPNLPRELTRDAWKRRMPPVEIVTLFQPLGSGSRNVWMVMSVRSPLVDLPVTPGSAVSRGLLDVRSDVPASYASAGYVIDQIGGCPGDGGGGAPTPGSRELSIVLDPYHRTSGCPQQTAGYIYYVGLARASSGSDPLSDSRGEPLVALAAVPVTFVVPETQSPSPNARDDARALGPPSLAA